MFSKIPLLGHSEPRERAKNPVAFLKKAKPLKESFKILRGYRPAQDDPQGELQKRIHVCFSLSVVPAGSWWRLTAIGNIYVLRRWTPHHTIKISSGKFLKGVGKLLSRSFLTKNAPPQNRAPCCSRHSTADFSLQEGGAKKNLSKRNADQGSFALCGARQGLLALDLASF